MKPFRRSLEDFGGPGSERRSEIARRIDEAAARARGEGHAAGFSEGYAAAAAEAAMAERDAVAALTEAARDLALDREAARAEAIDALGPVVAALARLAAPRAAAAGLADEVAAVVSARLAAVPSDRLVAHVPPALADALADRLGDAVEVRADAALGEAEARLEWEGGGAALDPAGCVAAAIEAVERFFGAAPRDDRGATPEPEPASPAAPAIDEEREKRHA